MNDRRQQAQAYEGGNAFLDGLPVGECRALAGDLRVVEFESRETILTRGGAIERIYFPIDALFSITAELRREERTDVYEVGMVGREGIVGFEAAFGSPESRRFVLSQVAGRAAVLPCRALTRRARASTALLDAIHAYVLQRIYAAEQLVGCSFAHNLTQRAARWLATVADKVGRAEFVLSREFLAMMLAIEPAAVPAALAGLRSAGAVRYDRDEELTVLRPHALREAACECYEALREHGDVRSGLRADGSG